MSPAPNSLVHWTHSGIDAPCAFTVIDFDYLDAGHGLAYSATLVHPDLGEIGRIANDGSGGPTTFHPYDGWRFGHGHLDKFLASCLRDGEPINRYPDARNNLLKAILSESETEEFVHEMRAEHGFLVRSYIPSAVYRFGSRRGAPSLLHRIRALRVERELLAGRLSSELDEPLDEGAFWQMFNGENWVPMPGPQPLNPEQLAGRAERIDQLVADQAPADDTTTAVPFDDTLFLSRSRGGLVLLCGDRVGRVETTRWCRCRRRRVIAFEGWNTGELEVSGTLHAAPRCRGLVRLD